MSAIAAGTASSRTRMCLTHGSHRLYGRSRHLGWPENTKELEYFYPTSVLITGYDIIFFWVARMIFSALEHTGKISV